MTMTVSADTKEDIAPFAKVATWDASRTEGCRASRIQEFHAEDVFLESDMESGSDGSFDVPVGPSDLGCIGLQWMERRLLTELGLRFAAGQNPPSPEDVQLQAWFGESQWQGGWYSLAYEVRAEDSVWLYSIKWAGTPDPQNGTRKVRWVFPRSSATPRVEELRAYTATEWDSAVLNLEAPVQDGGKTAEISLYNGRLTDSHDSPYRTKWDTSHPMEFTVRYARPRSSQSDRTVVRVRTPEGSFGIAVDDIVERGPVCVDAFGITASVGTARTDVTERKEQIDRAKTILDRVREMPDQVFENAFERVHNPVQDNGPTLISLACDNAKFIVGQDGTVEFMPTSETEEQKTRERLSYPSRIVPQFGDGQVERRGRELDGGWLPVPVSDFECGGVVYRERAFVAPYGEGMTGAPWLNTKPLGVVEFTIQNPSPHDAYASLELCFVQDSEENIECDLVISGDRVLASTDEALHAVVDLSEAGDLEVVAKDGRFTLSGRMGLEKTVRCFVYIPTWYMTREQHDELTGGETLLDTVREYWERILEPAAQVKIPDGFLERAIRASQVHCLIAARNEDGGSRIAPWIASVSYGPLESEANSIIRGMDFLGHTDLAGRSLDYFIRRYNEEGFLTTGYTMMGTGWHLWMLGEHYRLTRDKDWLIQVASEVSRVCSWVVRQTEKTKRLDAEGVRPPEYGLMPPGVQADWNAFGYHFSLNGYYYAGLESAARALADIEFPGSEQLLKTAREFQDNIIRAYRWAQEWSPVYPLRDGTWVPAYPGQLYCPGPTDQFFPGEDGNRSWCYDVELGAHQMVAHGVLEPDSREVEWMMNHMEDVQFLRDGMGDYPADRSERDWYDLGGFAKVQPYYCRNAEIYAMRDEVKPFIRSYFNTIGSLLNTENLSFWEHFHNIGAWNKTHETGYFLHQTRLMLAMERGEELWLAPFVTTNWMKNGMRVSLRNAPTFFGKVSYEITSHVNGGFIEATIECPQDRTLSRIVLRLRHPGEKPMKEVLVNGREHTDIDPSKECVYIEPIEGKITVRAEY